MRMHEVKMAHASRAPLTHLANVTRRGQTETTDEARAHVGQNVTVQVGHDHDTVCVRLRVLHNLQDLRDQRRAPTRPSARKRTRRHARSRRSSS